VLKLRSTLPTDDGIKIVKYQLAQGSESFHLGSSEARDSERPHYRTGRVEGPLFVKHGISHEKKVNLPSTIFHS
jgi:hypothetical protein